MSIGGIFLRFGATGLRLLEFCCAAVVLGIYSYFLAVLSDKNLHIPSWEKAVEGMSGAAVLYTIFGVLFTLCLGGVRFFAFLAIFLDILFAGCFAAIAYYTRHGTDHCNSGIVNTPLGTAPANEEAPGAGHFHYVCHLNEAVFAVSIISIFLFLVTAAWQILLVKHHQKEKRYGPSPSNNYTRGSRRQFWRRNKANKATTKDAEMATAGTAHLGRPSHETGSTLHGGYAPATTEPKYGQPGYGHGYQATNY